MSNTTFKFTPNEELRLKPLLKQYEEEGNAVTYIREHLSPTAVCYFTDSKLKWHIDYLYHTYVQDMDARFFSPGYQA